jgi:CBS domain-containing protein
MAEATRTDELRVRDVLQLDPVTIDRSASVQDLAELLFFHGIGGVPVVEDATRVVGVVSASDIVRLAAEQNEAPMWYVNEAGQPKPSAYFAGEAPGIVRGLVESSLAGFRVEDIMTPATFSVREEATLPELAGFLVKAGVHRALVMEEGHLRGVVTSMDVMRAVAAEIAPIRQPITRS